MRVIFFFTMLRILENKRNKLELKGHVKDIYIH